MTVPHRVSVVIASHNRRDTTLACLQSLAMQDVKADLRVVLYDDGSSDGTSEAVRQAWPNATILSGDGTAFWSGATRIAFKISVEMGCDFCLWLNDDVILQPNAIGRLLTTYASVASAHGPLCLIGGAVADPRSGRTSYAGLVRPSKRWPLHIVRCDPDPDQPKRCDTLPGNVVLIPAATIRAVGLIDPVYRHTLGDLDYGLRVVSLGGWVGLVAGHLGTCAANQSGLRWFNPGLSLRKRWQVVLHPLGFPVRPWLHFARRHGGPCWPIFAVLPYWRLFVPSAIARTLDRWRRRVPEPHRARAHAS